MTEQREAVTELENLTMRKNYLICAVWSCLRDISDLVEADEISSEDYELWEAATKHSAIQNRIKLAIGDSHE